MNHHELKELLDEQLARCNRPSFIESDPIQVPHAFDRAEDIEIAAFLTAMIAWGNRRAIIASARRLMALMDHRPYDFVTSAGDADRERLATFVHRTFNGTDCRFFMQALRNIYRRHGGLRRVFEDAYAETGDVAGTLTRFRQLFFELPHPARTGKHVPDVTRQSAAKRLNLFLMWMVRRDDCGVHFGLWDRIPPSALLIPLDVHCGTVARALGLLTRRQNDWRAVGELTAALRRYDPHDPVKYDFALFGMGIDRVLPGTRRAGFRPTPDACAGGS